MVDPESAHPVEVLLTPRPIGREKPSIKDAFKKEFMPALEIQISVACLILKSLPRTGRTRSAVQPPCSCLLPSR